MYGTGSGSGSNGGSKNEALACAKGNLKVIIVLLGKGEVSTPYFESRQMTLCE